ncbi:glycoside hydrolase family 19 protein [Rhodococcus sp. 14-2470-1a]|uniref:glycoside hydrolase family 19 protein n=1 Tax=Rhodococcus sp. 14-2470-1a TaxID=2023150 RepID=UPI00117B5FB8|nr:glycoside hydrolase family 19 protein [Rhodococcus sp. 14-2470-1a]
MDAGTLRRAMQETYVLDSVITEYLPHFEEAMRAAQIDTVRRAAAWCSQIGHESAGLRYMAEIERSNPSWSWDRTRYRGRGPIQLTWESNYRKFGQWCQGAGYVDNAELFVASPELVEQPRWGFLAASWYWLRGGPRAGRINAFADAGDILAVSRCVNGWVDTPNGMPDRQARYDRALRLGDALLPTEGVEMGWADEELSKEFPSRSKYRSSDEPIGTLAAYILWTDAAIHEMRTEQKALNGDAEAIALVKREADKGDAGAKAVLAKIGK